MEEAIKFWRTGFMKMMDGDKFDKQYLYNIRYNYGKEGKRTDYTPYSCIKIITSNTPGPGDYHGCPFKHSDVDLLKQKLQAHKINKTGVDEVVNYVKGGHYQLACGRYFEVTHAAKAGLDDIDMGFSPNHPNQYFDESQKIINGDRKNTTVKSQGGTPLIVRASQSTPKTQPVSQAKNKAAESEFDDMDFDDNDIPMTAEEMDQALAAAANPSASA